MLTNLAKTANLGKVVSFGKMSPRLLTNFGKGIIRVGKLAKTMNLVKRAIENKTHIAFWPKRQICFEVQLFYCKSSSTKSLYITCKCISFSIEISYTSNTSNSV